MSTLEAFLSEHPRGLLAVALTVVALILWVIAFGRRKTKKSREAETAVGTAPCLDPTLSDISGEKVRTDKGHKFSRLELQFELQRRARYPATTTAMGLTVDQTVTVEQLEAELAAMAPDEEDREWREWELALAREQRRLTPGSPFVRCVPKKDLQEGEAVPDHERQVELADVRRRLNELQSSWRRRAQEADVDEVRRMLLREWGHPFRDEP